MSRARPSKNSESSTAGLRALLVLGSGLFIFALLQSVVSPVLPAIGRRFDADSATTAWVLTAYMISASVFTPIIGRVGDRFGKHRMIMASLGALCAGSVMATLAWNIESLVAGRIVQGIGGGLVPLTFGVIRELFSGRSVARAYGAAAAILAVGNGFGLVLAGPIVEYAGYRWLFLFPALLSGAAALAAMFSVPASKVHTTDPLKFWPALLLSGWLVALLLAVSQGPQWGWNSPTIAGLFVGAIGGFLLWIRVEATSRHPLIDIRLLGRRTVGTVNLAALMFAISMYPLFALAPAMLQSPRTTSYGHGTTVSETGWLLLSEPIASFLGSLAAGYLAAYTGWKPLFLTATALGSIGYILLTFAHHDAWHIASAAAILGLAVGFAFSAMAGLVADAVPLAQIGVASGVTANLRTVGGALGIAVTTSFVGTHTDHTGFPTESAYVVTFIGLAALSAVAMLICMTLPRRDPTSRAKVEVNSELPSHSP